VTPTDVLPAADADSDEDEDEEEDGDDKTHTAGARHLANTTRTNQRITITMREV